MNLKVALALSVVTAVFLNSCGPNPQNSTQTPSQSNGIKKIKRYEPELVVAPSFQKGYKSAAVKYFRTHPMSVCSDDMKKKILDHIEQVIEAALSIVSADYSDEPKIDFILMQHSSAEDVLSYDDESRFSQDETYNILAQNEYDLIGFEGSGLEEFTIPAFIDELAKDTGKNPSSISSAWVKKTIQNDAVLRYQRDYPTVMVAGTEMNPLNIIGQAEIMNPTSDDPLTYYNLNVALRNDVALARIIILAKRKEAAKSAVVIGATHGAHLVILTRLWGCGGRFFRALSEEGKAKPHHQLENWRAN